MNLSCFLCRRVHIHIACQAHGSRVWLSSHQGYSTNPEETLNIQLAIEFGSVRSTGCLWWNEKRLVYVFDSLHERCSMNVYFQSGRLTRLIYLKINPPVRRGLRESWWLILIDHLIIQPLHITNPYFCENLSIIWNNLFPL